MTIILGSLSALWVLSECSDCSLTQKDEDWLLKTSLNQTNKWTNGWVKICISWAPVGAKNIYVFFRISHSSWRFGLSGWGERRGGWPNWRRYSRWAEQSDLFYIIRWPQSICSGYPECPSSHWSREGELYSPLSLQTINIDNLSQEKDRSQSGTLHTDQVAEIFRVYEVKRKKICHRMSYFIWLLGQPWWGGGTKSSNRGWTHFKGIVKYWKTQLKLKQQLF